MYKQVSTQDRQTEGKVFPPLSYSSYCKSIKGSDSGDDDDDVGSRFAWKGTSSCCFTQQKKVFQDLIRRSPKSWLQSLKWCMSSVCDRARRDSNRDSQAAPENSLWMRTNTKITTMVELLLNHQLWCDDFSKHCGDWLQTDLIPHGAAPKVLFCYRLPWSTFLFAQWVKLNGWKSS